MTNEREALIADLRYEAGRQGWNLPALLNKAADTLSQPSPAVPDSEMWRHKKSGGIYAWVMTVVREDDQKVLVVYRGVNDGVRWARPAAEFYDGRFERIDADDQPTEPALTYSSTQATTCAGCGERKHTPLRIDAMGGYVCLTCIDKKLGSLLGEFGHPEPAQPATQAGAGGRKWPFVLAPSLVAGLLSDALQEFDGDMLAAVRNVFIESGLLRLRSAAPTTEQPSLDWAVQGWRDEVQNRPLVNEHRRSLDWMWRKMVKRFGGDPDALLGPDHDVMQGFAPMPLHKASPGPDPATEQPGDAEMVEMIVRGCCETDPADAGQCDTICINVDDLRDVVQSQLDAARAARAAHGKKGEQG